jgi:hypothetical protein
MNALMACHLMFMLDDASLSRFNYFLSSGMLHHARLQLTPPGSLDHVGPHLTVVGLPLRRTPPAATEFPPPHSGPGPPRRSRATPTGLHCVKLHHARLHRVPPHRVVLLPPDFTTPTCCPPPCYVADLLLSTSSSSSKPANHR